MAGLEGLVEWVVAAQAATCPDQSNRVRGMGLSRIIEPTRAVSLSYAAREWLKMDRRTLLDSIDDSSLTAHQLSLRKWVFELDEIRRLNPVATADADPESS